MNDNAQKIIVGLFGIILLTIIVYCISTRGELRKKSEVEIAYFLQNSKLSIGTITGNSFLTVTGSQIFTDFTFEINVDNKAYYCNQGKFNSEILAPEISKRHFTVGIPFKEGEKYLVLVNDNNIKKSVMCLDKPIRDSIDFKRYIKEFQEIRNR